MHIEKFVLQPSERVFLLRLPLIHDVLSVAVETDGAPYLYVAMEEAGVRADFHFLSFRTGETFAVPVSRARYLGSYQLPNLHWAREEACHVYEVLP